jgi:glycosyltransferase involved in cell wall biosynthesis
MNFRAVQIVASLDPRHGGPSRSVVMLARAQARVRSPVALASLGAAPDGFAKTPGLYVHWARPDRPKRLASSHDLADFLKRHNFDAIHHHGLWLRPLHYAHQQAQRALVPLVVSPRGMMSAWAWNHRRWRKSFAEYFVHPNALTNAAGWHATSDAEAAEIRALGFRQPICVAPNGVDLPSPEQLATARDHWLSVVPSARERPIALFHSRLHSKKRLIELIDLWVSLPASDWQLVIVGIPGEFTVEQINDYVLRVIGQDRVLVVDGTYQPPPYAIASLFLLPSHSENFGLVIAESLAAGVPALVTDSTPWEGLNQNGAGWCVPWGQYGAALRTALREDAAHLRSRGQTGREWVGRSFVWDECARRLLDFYASVQPIA